jgi:hypothetical protein
MITGDLSCKSFRFEESLRDRDLGHLSPNENETHHSNLHSQGHDPLQASRIMSETDGAA